MPSITETFTGTGAGSESIQVTYDGNFTISVSGIGTATIALQRSLDSGTSWKTVESYTADTEKNGYEPDPSALYRFNCTAWTSGTVVCLISMCPGWS